MVDVLSLSCVTLEQNINSSKNEEGPLWTYFWNSIYQPGEQMNLTENHISPHPSNFLLQFNSDVLPEESASVAVINRRKKKKEQEENNREPHHFTDYHRCHTFFTFKFTSHKHKTYRILCRPKISDLLDAIRSKVKDGGDLDIVSYLDDEQDQVFISADTDLEDAVDQAIKTGQTCVKLMVQNQSKIHLNAFQNVKKKKKHSSSLLLPGAISFLGVTVVVAFICSRVSKQ